MTPLRLLSVTSGICRLVKIGGLTEVAGALPAALAVKIWRDRHLAAPRAISVQDAGTVT